MTAKIRLYLAWVKVYAKQIPMRGLIDVICMIYHVYYIVFGRNEGKHHLAKHRLNMKFLREHIFLDVKNAPVPSSINPNDYIIWVLWWQGEEQMPEIVKATYNSIKEASDKKVVLITKENIVDFVEVPLYISSKVENGKISLAALSDYIRVSLLYKYGGLWVDCTVLCAKKLPSEIFDKKLFSIKNKPSGTKYIAAGKWNVQFLGTNQVHAKVFYLMKSIFEQYWSKYSVIIDYLLVDYSFQYIYESDAECMAAFDSIPMSNSHMHELLPIMNDSFDSKIWDRLLSSGTYLFKLTYKWKYIERKDGMDTFYSYIVKNYG